MAQDLMATKYPNLYIDSKSGVYYARAMQNGRQIKKSFRTTNELEALVKLAAFLSDLGSPMVRTESMSWLAAVQLYKDQQAQRPNLKPRALESIVLFADHARGLVLEDMMASCITPSMCVQWWSRKAKSCSARTANGALGAVRNVFKLLLKLKCVQEDPTAELERMTIHRGRLNVPSRENFRRIVEEIRRAPFLRQYKERKLDSPAADFVEFLAYTGCRVGEARLMLWDYVEKDIIHIPSNKHAREWRTLPINPALEELLARLRAPYGEKVALGPILKIYSPVKALTNACERLGLPHVRVHDLRHFFATSCVECQVDIPTLSRWLGHQDGGALAMRVYGHLRDAHSLESARRVQF